MLLLLTTNTMTYGDWAWLAALVGVFMLALFSAFQFFEHSSSQEDANKLKQRVTIDALHVLAPEKQADVYAELIAKDDPTKMDMMAIARLTEIKNGYPSEATEKTERT